MQEIVVITERITIVSVFGKILSEVIGLLIQPATVLREIKEN
jgi:hypothetical protein